MTPLETPFILIENKVYALIRNQLLKAIKPTFNINNIINIDIDFVKKLKSEYGIGGLIVDVDDTLRTDSNGINECNQEWLEFMKKEFRIAIVSNGYSENVEKTLEKLHIEYFSKCNKPARKFFLQAADKMGLNPENVLVVGDGAIMDAWGGKRSGMFTAVVNRVVKNELDMER